MNVLVSETRNAWVNVLERYFSMLTSAKSGQLPGPIILPSSSTTSNNDEGNNYGKDQTLSLDAPVTQRAKMFDDTDAYLKLPSANNDPNDKMYDNEIDAHVYACIDKMICGTLDASDPSEEEMAKRNNNIHWGRNAEVETPLALDYSASPSLTTSVFKLLELDLTLSNCDGIVDSLILQGRFLYTKDAQAKHQLLKRELPAVTLADYQPKPQVNTAFKKIQQEGAAIMTTFLPPIPLGTPPPLPLGRHRRKRELQVLPNQDRCVIQNQRKRESASRQTSNTASSSSSTPIDTSSLISFDSLDKGISGPSNMLDAPPFIPDFYSGPHYPSLTSNGSNTDQEFMPPPFFPDFSSGPQFPSLTSNGWNGNNLMMSDQQMTILLLVSNFQCPFWTSLSFLDRRWVQR
ncbi:hypothetical protein F5880DRAFT_1511297 [Lentinula raphanica]|nr:hypothetical protein F5880DRAFT_1511297 [Lentinula raphanica]